MNKEMYALLSSKCDNYKILCKINSVNAKHYCTIINSTSFGEGDSAIIDEKAKILKNNYQVLFHTPDDSFSISSVSDLVSYTQKYFKISDYFN